MKITGFKISAYTAPYAKPITNGLYTYTDTEIVLCELRTASGATGIGWTHGGNIVYQSMIEIAQSVVGEDVTCTERLWRRMYRPKLWGRRGLTTRAISAIDIAAWDCIAKRADLPAHRLFGGYSKSVPAYMAGGYYEDGKSVSDLQTEMREKVESGARAVKMKIGAVPLAEDIDRVKAAREALGPDAELLVDANNAYSRIEAAQMAQALDELGVYWFEEPLDPDDLAGAADLASRFSTPIALGENEYTKFGFHDVLAHRAADVLNADAQILGGITEWRKVASIAETRHIPVAPHGDQEIHVHLVSAVPNGLIVEYYDNSLNTLKDAMFDERLELNSDGGITPPDRPGFGFTVNYKNIKQFQQASETINN